MTVLLTTHYLDEADRLAHRLAIVDRGRVAVEGSPDELKTELRGDVVSVEVGSPELAARTARVLAGMPGLSEPVAEGTTVRAGTELGARAVPQVFAALADAGIAVVSTTVARPSLDDVYLRHAGRTFEAVA